MSTICINFIENAWRKDLCANCFRTKEEHLAIKSKMYAQRTFNSGHVSINVHHQNGLPEIGYQSQSQTGRIPMARGRSSNLYSAYESPNRERVNVVNQQPQQQHQQQQRRNQSMITQDNGTNVNVNGSNYNTKATTMSHQPKFNPGQSQNQSQNQRNISNVGVTSGSSSTLSVKSSLRMDKRTAGILKKSNRRKMSVSFPKEVVSVIGYGGSDSSSDSESDSEPVADPLDNLTITEIMQRNSNTATEKEINRQTIRNTSFNSIKNNLLGYAPLIIGPIVGGTGGRSKPVVTIGSFGESQSKPHQVATSNGVKISVGQGSSQIIENRQTNPPRSSSSSNQINVPVSRVPSVNVSSTRSTQQPNVQIVTPQVQSQNSQSQRVTTQMVAPVRNSLNGRNQVTTRVPTTTTTTNQQQNTNIIRVSSAIIPPMPSPRSSLANTNGNGNAKDPIKSEQSIIIMNGGLIASKRTSFLNGILGDQPGEELHPGMQLQMDSLEPTAMAALVQAQQEMLETNAEPPRPSQAQTIIDFDSLEDSGIENKVEPDMNVKEKPKPAEDSSDSGNENDFSESSCSNVPRPESSGLLIACSDLAETRIDASKLSPDSVISNTSSGSNESLDKQNIQEPEPSPVMAMPMPITIPPMLKRPAPLPPIAPQLNSPERRPSQVLPTRSMSSQDLAITPRRSIQTQDLAQIRRSAHAHIPERNSPERQTPKSQNSPPRRHSDLQCDELYDDINGACQKSSEDIYDDCTSASGAAAAQRSATYDLTDTRLQPIRTDGIEFIGIRKIDEDAPPPPATEPIEPPIKEKKVRKVNQFFSTIGKKAGAAFGANRSVVESSEKSDSSRPFTRSLSIDEVNITRTQGIYATLSPSLFRGTGFLNKLKGEEPAEDVRKGRKFSVISLRKFLGLTGRDERRLDVDKPGEPQAEVESPNPRMPLQSPPAWKLPPARPPPPPPRVGSLDLLDRCGQAQGQGQGHGKPARPPPPAVLRPAAPLPKEEPEFLSVFQGQGPSYSQGHQGQGPSYSQSQGQGQPPTHRTPNKPRRKASMRCGETSDGGAYTANYLETTYNHITSLNFETLKLIASQEAALIQSTNHPKPYNVLRFTNFYVTDVDPICCGNGYCFYSAFWEDTDCIILIQESLTSGRMPLEFNCVQQMATFEDVVPQQFVKWEPSDFVKCSGGIKAFITILPSCNVAKLSAFIANPSIPITRKYFTILQAMDHWGNEDLADLVVFHQPIEESAQSNVVGLIYVCSSRIKSGCFISSNNSRANFELSLRQLLVNLLNDNDKQILHRRLYSCGSAEVEAQLKLFIQLKLFGPQGSDLDKILRYRSSKQVTQWMDKERAASMKDAIERTLRRHSERIEPLRKAFVEFLMMSDNCAAGVLDFVVDMNPDF